jgi:DNA gyrase/topoisomerase IV subunit B
MVTPWGVAPPNANLPNNAGTLTMEVALQYNDTYSETIFSFANNINTVDGGTYLTGFRTALTRTINKFGQDQGVAPGGAPVQLAVEPVSTPARE